MVKGNALTGKDGFDGNVHLAQPRITAEGTLTVNGVDYPVTGIFWVEHQWLTPGAGGDDPQWNWFTFQFGDQTELTLGIVHPVPDDPAKKAAQPLGCFLDPAGSPTYLMMDDIQWSRTHPWTSPRTGILYPGIEHDITIPSLGIQIHSAPFIEDNEVCSNLSGSDGLDALFYEGASRVAGTRAGTPIQGVGYTELVGFTKGGKILP
jgi:predicted secreted hydrolase